MGNKVALIQNRPVLGGNNSSEVRVGLSGLIFKSPYPNLGKVVDEIGPIGHWTLFEAKQDPDAERSKKILKVIEENPEKKQHNAGPKSNYEDEKKIEIVKNEKNIDLFLNTHVFVSKTRQKITAVVGKNLPVERINFRGKLFADCTGDATLGYLAVQTLMGKKVNGTGEKSCTCKPDSLVMELQFNVFR